MMKMMDSFQASADRVRSIVQRIRRLAGGTLEERLLTGFTEGVLWPVMFAETVCISLKTTGTIDTSCWLKP